MDEEWSQLCSQMADLKSRMKEAGLLKDLQAGDECFPDPVDEEWNDAIDAAAKVAESYEPRCDTCPSGVASAILALKRQPSIYEGPVILSDRARYKWP